MPTHQEVQLLPHVRSVTLADLRNVVAATGQEPLRTALAVMDYARRRVPANKVGSADGDFHIWGAGALALAALGLDHAPPPDGDFVCPPNRIVRRLLRRAAGLTTEGRIRARTPEEISAETHLALLRILSLQSSVQGDAVSQFYRTLFLLEAIDDQGNLADASPFDSLFTGPFGATVLDYLTVLLGLYAMSAKSTVADLRLLFGTCQRQ